MTFTEEKQWDSFKARLDKRQNKELKEMMVCLALERSGLSRLEKLGSVHARAGWVQAVLIVGGLVCVFAGTHADLVERLFSFLKKPSASQCTGKAPPGSRKKSKAKAKKKSTGSKSKTADGKVPHTWPSPVQRFRDFFGYFKP